MTNEDTAKISEEVSGLKAEISKFIETVTEYVHSRGGAAAHCLQDTAEDTWNEAKHQLGSVKQHIQEEPVKSAAIAFGAGMLIGFLLSAGRRR